MEWKNETEKIGFETLGHLERYFSAMGLCDTQDAVALLTKRKNERGEVDWDLLDDIRELFPLEICQVHPECENSYKILNELVIEVSGVVVKRRKTWRMLAGHWDIDEIERNGHLQKKR